jgi:hypothetical protein
MNLILDTAGSEHLERFLSHTPPHVDNQYAVANNQVSQVSPFLHLSGAELTATNTALLSLIRRLKPTRIVLLVNNPSRQSRIAAALYLWRSLFGLSYQIAVSWSGKPAVAMDGYHRYLIFRHDPYSFFKELWVFSALKLTLLLVFYKFLGISVLPILLIHFIVAEIVLRIRNHSWQRRLAASPFGKRGTHHRGDRWHPFDEYLGLVEAPNLDTMARCTVPTMETDHTYRTRTDALGRRLTDEPGDQGDSPVISLFGCSFTFGSGLSDEDTFGWLLQKRFPGYKLLNYGMGATSAYQALLLIEKTLAIDKPAAVVLGYQPTLDKRNIGRLDLLPWYAGPSCVSLKSHSGKQALRRYPPKRYKRLPGAEHSALIKATEKRLNWLRTFGRGSDKDAQTTMEHLFAQMRHTCETQGVRFIVASLTACNPHQAYLQSHGFSWCSVDFDEQETDETGHYNWSLLPFVKHPNSAANREYCRTIGDALDKELRNERAVPEATTLNRLAQLNKAPRKLEEFIYPHW